MEEFLSRTVDDRMCRHLDGRRRLGDFGCYGGGSQWCADAQRRPDRPEGLLLTSCYSEPSCTPTGIHHDGRLPMRTAS